MSGPYRLITLDVWDTVLRRSVHPDEVKVHTARWLQLHHADRLRPEVAGDLRALFRARCAAEGAVGARWKAAGEDDEYTLAEVYAEWLGAVARPAAIDGLAAELEEVELRFEEGAIRLDEGIEAELATHGDGWELAIVSDFYMGAASLERLLRHAGFARPIRAIYVSCDHRLNKRSGRLFAKLQAELGVPPGEHLHIGDNAHSDVAVPRGLGIQAVHYRPAHGEAALARSRERFGWRDEKVAPARLLAAAQAATITPAQLGEAERGFFALGVRYGLPFFAFVYAVLEDALRKKHTRIHYFTREGVFFQEIHDRIAAVNPFPGPLPASDLLAVSRVGTFCASLAAPTTAELMRVWNQYSTQSMTALWSTLDVPWGRYEPLLRRHGIDGQRPIQYPWADPAVQRLFADPDLVQLLGGDIAARRALLLEYLGAHGLTPETPAAAMVDIGWRGTIQDNLACLLPETRLDGYYFGLFGFLNAQPPNVTKVGLFSDANRGQASHVAFEHPSVIEMLCNSATGSVLRYERGDGEVRPVTENHPAEDRVWHEAVRWFQAGVLALTASLCHELALHHVEASELVDEGRRQLTGLVASPPRPLARAYFGLSHNEGFGLGSLVEKRARFPFYRFMRGLTSRTQRDQFVRAVEHSGWAQGLFNYWGLGPLTKLYNERVLHLDADGGVHRS